MSETDSFIDEVSEEVRRDKLYSMMRKYGWIGVAFVVLLVGGAAFNEWQKADARAAARALGDAILAAENIEDPAKRTEALNAINAQDNAAAVVALFAITDDEDGAAKLLAISDDTSVDSLYRDLASLKLVSMRAANLDVDARRSRLETLAIAGGAFRVLAEEQLALIDIEQDDTDAAKARLTALLVDEEASGALNRRVSQLLVALGGNLSVEADASK